MQERLGFESCRTDADPDTDSGTDSGTPSISRRKTNRAMVRLHRSSIERPSAVHGFFLKVWSRRPDLNR